jgi:hypothetical protein
VGDTELNLSGNNNRSKALLLPYLFYNYIEVTFLFNRLLSSANKHV